MIGVYSTSQIRGIDKCTIVNQYIQSVDLMEQAALSVYEFISQSLVSKQKIKIFAGMGNNGGDALALARMLLAGEGDYQIKVFIVGSLENMSDDCRINKDRLERLMKIHYIHNYQDIPSIAKDAVIIDGLFGSGLNRPLGGICKDVVGVINRSWAKVYSIDIPSGLFVDDNGANDFSAVVKADEVLTFQFPKLSLLLPQETDCYRKMTILDIGLCEKCIEKQFTDYYYIERSDIVDKIQDRVIFSHKGIFGHALLIVGSYGKMGAAVLAARSCLRTGVGLLTVHVPACGVDILQVAVPEAVVDADGCDKSISKVEFDKRATIGIGCGIGQGVEAQELVRSLLRESDRPLVIDADALNIIAKNGFTGDIPKNSILTPHPVEFDRLTGVSVSNSIQRLELARKYAAENGVYIVLKGAHTAIITPDSKVYFNSTGNPGMATAGSGDVLTGMITSLLAQKYSPLDAAVVGVYLHGLAGDLAKMIKSEYGLLASDIIESISGAYASLNK